MEPKIGIIGCGFVGSAVAAGFTTYADIKIYDKFKQGFDSLAEVVGQEFIFLCLPTPMDSKGDAVTVELFDAARQIDALSEWPRSIVVKSTVPPGTTRLLQEMYPRHKWFMNPEFLTARSARLDFINSARIIIGGKDPGDCTDLALLYRKRFPATPIYQTVWELAEFVKYMNNCFFALKISYLNQCYDALEELGLPYDDAKKMFMADGRIGNSHLDVPGHDGDRGYGGTCFPKDMNAFINWARHKGTPLTVLEAAKQYNDKIRKKKDWEVKS